MIADFTDPCQPREISKLLLLLLLFQAEKSLPPVWSPEMVDWTLH